MRAAEGVEEDGMDEDEEDLVPEIMPSHFESSMHDARRSVSEADLAKYSSFARTMSMQRSSAGTGVSDFRFPTSGAAAAADDDDEDDLYG